MISLVIGTDVPFVWHVKANGQPVLLDNHTVTLYVENSRGSFRLSDLIIEGDQVRATYPGAIQTRLGEHSLILRLNEGQKGMATVSVQNAFKLVAWGKDAGGENEGPVQVNALVFESELSFGNAEADLSAYLTKEEAEKTYLKKGEGGESYDDTEVKAELARLEKNKADKSELTELSTQVSGLSKRVDNLPTAESSVFEAEYGVTTFAVVKAANEAGKVVICNYNGYVFRLTRVMDSELTFVANNVGYIHLLYLTKFDVWWSNYADVRHELKDLDNGNVQLTIAGKSAEVATPQYVDEKVAQSGGGGGTPSGEPMHYMFEAVGATYNATDADIPMVGIYGDSYVHKAHHWHLNELGDISNEEMREIYAVSFPMQRRILLESAFANTNIRTNIPIWRGCETTAYGSATSTKGSLFGLGCNSSLEVFAWIVDSGETMNIVKNFNLSSVTNLFDFRGKESKIKKVLGEINLTNLASTYSMFSKCTSIEEIRLYKLGADLDIKAAPLLSYASIKFLLSNSNATSKKTLTLHATALANAEAAYLADGEQDHTTYPTLSDWALSKNIQIATA